MYDEYDDRPSWRMAIDDAWWSVKRRVRLVCEAIWDWLHPRFVAERRRRAIEAAKLLPQHWDCQCVLTELTPDPGDATLNP